MNPEEATKLAHTLAWIFAIVWGIDAFLYPHLIGKERKPVDAWDCGLHAVRTAFGIWLMWYVLQH